MTLPLLFVKGMRIMANTRKDPKGRVLRKGESYNKNKKKYVYSYTSPLGQRKFIYSSDLLTLRKKEDELVKNQLDGLDIYTMGEADINFVFDRYITTKTELRGNTRSNYEYMYNHYVRDTFGKKKIADVKYSDVLYFYMDLSEKYSISLVESIQSVLHPTFNLALRDDIIRKNPTDKVVSEVKKKSCGKKAGIRHALTIPQQKAFLDYLYSKDELARWKNVFVVLLGTGVRIGECVGLRWQDCDFENRMISINHSITYYPRKEGTYKCEYEVSLPKTEAGIREIPMIPQVYDALMAEKKFQEETGFECISVIDGMSGFIFFNRFYTLHNPAAINRAIKRICEDYNREEIVKAKKEHRDPIILPHFSCHHLRHTFCTRLCENETNVKLIQEIMGHKDIQTTLDIYAEITAPKKKEALTELSDKLLVM